MCVHTYLSLYFLSVVLSAVSQRQPYRSLYDCNPSVITLDLEYLTQKVCNKRCFFPHQRTTFVPFDFYCLDSQNISSSVKHSAGVPVVSLWNTSAVIVSSQLGSLSPAHRCRDVARRVIQGEEYLCGASDLSERQTFEFNATAPRLTSSLF